MPTQKSRANGFDHPLDPGASPALPESLPASLLQANGQEIHDADVNLGCIDVSKLTITLSSSPKPVPPPESLVWGTTMTDHMLIMSFEPASGWSAPEIRPYGPLSLDPASSCFQYCPNLFEGMKAYLGSDGQPRLFRPDQNMARMARSAARLALPPFDTEALLALIKKLVMIDARWISPLHGYSLYIRPTLIGTRAALGVKPSTHAMLYVILSPVGLLFKPPATIPPRRSWVSLLASSAYVRAWPGGTGSYKLGGNYSPSFQPQREAAKNNYSQILWLLPVETPGGKELQVTECGLMNFMCVLKRDDGGVDLVTPSLDGTILPGVTRDSVLFLAAQHNLGSPLLGLSPDLQLRVRETTIYMSDIVRWKQEGRLLEAFGCGTAAVLVGVSKIGWEGKDVWFNPNMADELKDGEKDVNGLGPVGKALYEEILYIQEGKIEGHEWSVSCME